MLLWTIQHKAAYDILLETGRLIANEKYLLFDGGLRCYYEWIEHVVLNDGYLPLYDKDDIEDPSEDEKLKSWENVFCIDEVTDCWYVPKTTQATFWELKKKWVLKAEHFVLAG